MVTQVYNYGTEKGKSEDAFEQTYFNFILGLSQRGNSITSDKLGNQ